MSAIQEYVHLTWKGYTESGTYRNYDNEYKKNNYDPEVFTRFRDNIISRANNIEVSRIKKWETEMNNGAKGFVAAFKQLKQAERVKIAQDFFLPKSVVKALINDIEDIEVDENTFSVKIIWKESSAKVSETASMKSVANVEHYRWLGTLINRGQQLLTELEKESNNQNTQNYKTLVELVQQLIQFALGNDQWQDIIEKIGKNAPNLAKELQKSFPKHVANKKIQGVPGLNDCKDIKISANAANMILGQMNMLSAGLDLVEDIAQIQSNWSEFLIQNIKSTFETDVKNMATKIVIDDLRKSAGGNRLRSGVFPQRNSVNNNWVNVQILQEIFIEEGNAITQAKENGQKAPKRTVRRIKKKDGSGYTLEFAVKPHKIEQKADTANLDFLINFSQARASVKHYDLSQETFMNPITGKQETRTVELQDVRFIKFLQGVQTAHNRLGTHFLNIMVNHEDEESQTLDSYSKAKERADNALCVALLYSAATGRMQGTIGTDSFANVLVFHRKENIQGENFSQISIVSIDQLVNYIYKHNLFANVFRPDPTAIRFSNPHIDKDVLSYRSATARLTRVMHGVMQTKFNVVLPHSIINKVTAKRGLT